MTDDHCGKTETPADSCEKIFSERRKHIRIIEKDCLWYCPDKQNCSEGIFGKIMLIILEKKIIVRSNYKFVRLLAGQIAKKRLAKCSFCNQQRFSSIDSENFREPERLMVDGIIQPNQLTVEGWRILRDVFQELKLEDKDLFEKRIIREHTFFEIGVLNGEIDELTSDREKERIVNKYIVRLRRIIQKMRDQLLSHSGTKNNPKLRAAFEELLGQINTAAGKNPVKAAKPNSL